MKARKYEDVEFVIDQKADNFQANIIWKKGGLYLSLSGLFLTDGTTWYELPVRDLDNISIIREEPLKLKFKIPSFDVTISGEHAERLLALRHFLLPYISGKKHENEMKALLKLWAIGIRDPHILRKLLGLDQEKVEELIKKARAEKILYENGDIGPNGNSMLTDEEREFLGLED